ncbi:MAG: hypothetical protein B7Y19_09745, partial [Sphingobacteriales bacterium 24-40-4]
MATGATNELIIPIEGMESDHCALIVDKVLANTKRILTHKVELNNKRAVITIDDALSMLPVLVKSIRDSGYDVATVKKSYPVLNMSCASCASSAQTILQSQIGVIKAAVNYGNGAALIEFI